MITSHSGGGNWGYKYKDDILALLSSGEQKKQQQSWFSLFSTNGSIPCFEKWQGFSREGRFNRSSLNKVIFKKTEYKNNYLRVREIPENNFFATEFLRRESFNNSLLAFPKSFYEINKEYFNNLGFNSSSISSLQQRQLKFEIEKERMQTTNKYWTRSWINAMLAASHQYEKKFHLDRTKTYYDLDHQCVNSEGSDGQEVHSVTGFAPHKDALKNCEERNKRDREQGLIKN